MERTMGFFRKHDIQILLVVLVLSFSGLSWYNYHTQKNLLLEQMQSDSGDIVNSITAAMSRFHDIKSTMNLQRLINDVSLKLEIFEFRYLEPDGVIRNSMFKQEIDQVHGSESFKKTMLGDMELGAFFFETRDFVPVMAIYYPIYMKGQLVGIIDLSVDVSEYDLVNEAKPDFSLMRRQVDISNLLKSIDGSIQNSLAIFEETDLYDFLHRYVKSAKNIVQISIVDQTGKVVTSSNNALIDTVLTTKELPPPELININERPVYRIVTQNRSFDGRENSQLMLLIDAAPYAKNEQRLLRNSLMISIIALLFALFIARAIYRSAIEHSRQEKERLEELVKERTHEIELLSKTDALTGLWNRGYLEEMMEMEFKRARRYAHDISLLVVDLDHFKNVNDTYGHAAGDEVLREASQRITSSLRETDFVGRYGGEEIVIILPETSIETAKEIGQKVCDEMAKEPVVSDGETIHVTASLGISHLRPEHTGQQEVFNEADQALYISKQNGRNRVTVFNTSIGSE